MLRPHPSLPPAQSYAGWRHQRCCFQFRSLPARQRTDFQPAIPILAMPAGLFLFPHACATLRIVSRYGILGACSVTSAPYFAMRFFQRHVDMPLPHPTQHHLLRFQMADEFKTRVLLNELVQPKTHFFNIRFGFRLDRKDITGLTTGIPGVPDGRLFIVERIARECPSTFQSPRYLPPRHRAIRRVLFSRTWRTGAPSLPHLLGSVVHTVLSAQRSRIYPHVRQSPDKWIDERLEYQCREREPSHAVHVDRAAVSDGLTPAMAPTGHGRSVTAAGGRHHAGTNESHYDATPNLPPRGTNVRRQTPIRKPCTNMSSVNPRCFHRARVALRPVQPRVRSHAAWPPPPGPSRHSGHRPLLCLWTIRPDRQHTILQQIRHPCSSADHCRSRPSAEPPQFPTRRSIPPGFCHIAFPLYPAQIIQTPCKEAGGSTNDHTVADHAYIPSPALTTSTTASATRRAERTSATKAGAPGVSRRLSTCRRRATDDGGIGTNCDGGFLQARNRIPCCLRAQSPEER